MPVNVPKANLHTEHAFSHERFIVLAQLGRENLFPGFSKRRQTRA